MARSTVALRSEYASAAPDVIGETLGALWDRASWYENAFHEVAGGVSPREALAAIDEDSTAGHLIPMPPWFGGDPVGTSWDVLAGLPADFEQALDGLAVPDGYTKAEYAATLATIPRLQMRLGLTDACVGPVLIHADGVVECYGCTDPNEGTHLSGTSVACDLLMRLGQGHVCPRCLGDDAA